MYLCCLSEGDKFYYEGRLCKLKEVYTNCFYGCFLDSGGVFYFVNPWIKVTPFFKQLSLF